MQLSHEDPRALKPQHLPPLTLCLGCAGEWWLEFYRFYSGRDIKHLATQADKTLHLPSDFQHPWELLRDTDRQHCRCAHRHAESMGRRQAALVQKRVEAYSSERGGM